MFAPPVSGIHHCLKRTLNVHHTIYCSGSRGSIDPQRYVKPHRVVRGVEMGFQSECYSKTEFSFKKRFSGLYFQFVVLYKSYVPMLSAIISMPAANNFVDKS